MENKTYDIEKLDKSMFEFVQQDQKIYDKELQTEPVGYFKDAFIRFSKNKTNVVASLILLSLVLLSIFVPLLTEKNYTRHVTELADLPPRVPLLERLGILDGTREFENIIVDLENFDEETGLYYPVGYDPEFIIPGSLTNYDEACTDKAELCKGGLINFYLRSGKTLGVVESRDSFTFAPNKASTITIDVQSLTKGASIELVIQNTLTIGTIEEAGIHSFNVSELIDSPISSKLQIRLHASENGADTLLKSVTLTDNTNSEPILVHEGYTLSNYQELTASDAVYARTGATIKKSKFKYDAYQAAFSDREYKAFSINEYNQIIAENSDVCQPIPDPENPDGWLLGEGCPIRKVINQSEMVQGPDGNYYGTYHVVINYAALQGFEKLPYFYFGTDGSGRDLFALVFLGLRTSLLIGIIIASINIFVGIIYGAIEGYYGGKVDLLMERFGEIIGRIPFLVWLALIIVIVKDNGALVLILSLTITGWLGVASVTRTQFYRYKGREYVLASRTLGAKDSRLIFRHILPNGIGTIITSSILMIPSVIFSESTISYLGFGLGSGQTLNLFGLKLSGTSLGVLLNSGRVALTKQPYLTIAPAIIIAILMITFNMFGNALRDAFNPSLRGAEE